MAIPMASSFNVLMLRKLEGIPIIKVQSQVIDAFNKCVFLLCLIDNKTKVCIPVIPSKYFIREGIPLTRVTGTRDFMDYLNTFNNTIKIFDWISKKALGNDMNYSFNGSVILDNSGLMIEGIELMGGLIVPINPSIPMKERERRDYTTSSKKIFFEINEAIMEKYKNPLVIDQDFIDEICDIEIYNRLLIEIARYLEVHQSIKEELIDIMGSSPSSWNNLMSFFDQLIDKITIMTEKISGTNDTIQWIENNNIRMPCDKMNPFCHDNKLMVPMDRKNIFKGQIVEALINNEQFRFEILNNNLSIIIDKYNFKDSDDHVYIKRDIIIPTGERKK